MRGRRARSPPVKVAPLPGALPKSSGWTSRPRANYESIIADCWRLTSSSMFWLSYRALQTIGLDVDAARSNFDSGRVYCRRSSDDPGVDD